MIFQRLTFVLAIAELIAGLGVSVYAGGNWLAWAITYRQKYSLDWDAVKNVAICIVILPLLSIALAAVILWIGGWL